MEPPSPRSTFDDGSTDHSKQDRHDDSASPASKYRRTRDGENAFSADRKRVAIRSPSSPQRDAETSPLGFSPSEFLPLDHAKKAAAVRKQRILFSATADTNRLSDDALGLCLFGGFLDTLEIVRLTRVSKRIRKLASKQVKRLDLRSCETLTPANIASISTSFPNITSVDFSYCKQFGEAHLEQLLPVSGTLTDLGLRGTSVDDESIASYLTKVHSGYGQSCLESIDLSATTTAGSTLVGDISAYSISTYCPNLRSLCLAWNSLLSDDGLASLTSLSKLTKLDVSLTGVTSKSSHHLLQMMNEDDGACLTDLDLSATKIGEEGIETLFSQPCSSSLQRLNFQFMEELTPGLVETFLEGAPHLTFLDVTHGGSEGKIQIRPFLMGTIHQQGIKLKGAVFAACDGDVVSAR